MTDHLGVLAGVSVCCDTAQALVFLLVSVCVVTQPKPRCSCWCQCVVTQPKPWFSCWCQCVLRHSPSLGFLAGVSVCCDTAQALMFLLVSVRCDTAQALVFLLVSACCDTAQALVFLLVSACCDTAQVTAGSIFKCADSMIQSQSAEDLCRFSSPYYF